MNAEKLKQFREKKRELSWLNERLERNDGILKASVRERLALRMKRLSEDVEEVESFIDTVGDSGVRQIIELKYIEGKTWREVAEQVYGYLSPDAARKKLARFFE